MWKLLETWLPGLSRELQEGGASTRPTGTTASPPDTWKAGHSQTGGEFSSASLANVRLEQLALLGTRLERLSLQGVRLDEAVLTRCVLDRATLRQTVLRSARLTLVSLEEAALEDVDLSSASLSGLSLRDAALSRTDLHGAHVLLSDGMSLKLSRVDATGSVWTASSLAFATLEDVDFTDADLRGLSLRYAHLHEVRFSGAKLEGADFRGVVGLSDEQRRELLQAGITTLDGWVEQLLFRALARPSASRSLEQADRLARGWALGIRAGTLLALIALVTVLVVGGPLRPEQRGPEAPIPTGNIPLSPAKPEAEKATRESLEALRAAIAAHYERTKAAGFPRYPLQEELAQNEVDVDGLGPSQERVVLHSGGLPPNLLTEGEGTAPYCNPVPTQGTLTGDDTDWHYCEETGRVYACGGHTTAPTLSW